MSASTNNRIAIEFISFLGMQPAASVAVAADLGCSYIGMALAPVVFDATLYSQWSLRDEPGLRRNTIAALRDLGVTVSLGEGFMATPGKDIRDASADLDLMAELGAERVNLLVFDSDWARAMDQCAAFAELAASRGMNATLEFLPGMPPAEDLPSALEIVEHVGRAEFGVLVDTMHLFRSGATVASFASANPASIGYVQLCDVPFISRHASYADEARFDRLAPGDGELPLAEFVGGLQDDLIIGLEVPMLAQAKSGKGPHERLAYAISATRALFSPEPQ